MRKIYKRHNFAFSPELDELIRRLASETEWRLVQIVEKSVKMYAEFHDKEKNEK
jgi:hypothetical protein